MGKVGIFNHGVLDISYTLKMKIKEQKLIQCVITDLHGQLGKALSLWDSWLPSNHRPWQEQIEM